MNRFSFAAVLSTLFFCLACSESRVDFNTEVKPILNKRCISCHGGVKQSGGFSVLFREEALDSTESGAVGVVPGDPAKSEMIRRLTLTDPEERMPYKEEKLSDAEIDILTRWVAQGAEWGKHWAYVSPKESAELSSSTLLSSLDSKESWGNNEIDHFVLEKLRSVKMEPSPEAGKATLLRRLYFDLIGIPPTEAETNKFITNSDPRAYEQVVDNLLSSPAYGEKWASWWLDLARYSDTKGYERDAGRSIWRYRDWVIKSFNADLPFDQFTIQQLAGDLLPNPTDEQLIATAFHRNTMNNDEGGTEDEEFRVAATMDRVNTTWEVWQSTTLACVQCHSHPYDPFVHEDYYSSLAFFNNSRDEDTQGEHPNLRTFTEAADQAKLQQIESWIRTTAGEEQSHEMVSFLKTFEPKYHPHDFDEFKNSELNDTKWLGFRNFSSARLKNVDLSNKANLVFEYWADNKNGLLDIRADKVDGKVLASNVKLNGRGVVRVPLQPIDGTHDLYFVYKNPTGSLDKYSVNVVWVAFRNAFPDGADTNNKKALFDELLNAKADVTPVMIENKGDRMRKSFMFERGNWLVHGKSVNPGVPATLNAFPKDAPANRLGLAQWIVSEENPLTARTIVNRFWEQIFGYGLVETLEDFGTQGALPSHPELLDWLALRFMRTNQWSMKKTIRDIVMSSTYRQDSKITDQLLARDPGNRLLARGPRVRLSAEQVRDQALAVSGLLSHKMYGKSVMPFQPEGVWSTVYNGETWKTSTGEDQYRRGVYTYTKRTSPYPLSITFDGSSREVCLSRRIRTNTPLQALVTLNDPVFIECARALAKNLSGIDGDVRNKIERGYFLSTSRNISEEKYQALHGLYEEGLRAYTKDKEALKKITNDSTTPSVELGALILVSNAMFNLDEVLTKE
ncbi:MAG: DUF1553 domain-containing protein [Chryseolinea sp.]